MFVFLQWKSRQQVHNFYRQCCPNLLCWFLRFIVYHVLAPKGQSLIVFHRCNNGFTLSSGKCLNLSQDQSNCGRVGNVCQLVTNALTNICTNGTCVMTCKTGSQLSGGQCIPTDDDEANCGSVGNTCPTTANGAAQCTKGQCSIIW